MNKENPPDAKPEIEQPPIPEPILANDAVPELQTVNTPTSEDPPNYFEFRDVCKSFDGRVVLDQVSFKVKRGETCVIMGRSGVGKSVSLKHIMGFLKPDSGQSIHRWPGRDRLHRRANLKRFAARSPWCFSRARCLIR